LEEGLDMAEVEIGALAFFRGVYGSRQGSVGAVLAESGRLALRSPFTSVPL
jgi:hypothetical protein